MRFSIKYIITDLYFRNTNNITNYCPIAKNLSNLILIRNSYYITNKIIYFRYVEQWYECR